MDIITNILKQMAPTLGMLVVALILYYVKLTIERTRYAKQSENHVLIFTLPKAGKLKHKLVPIEVEGGISLVKVPNMKGEVTPLSPTHILGEQGEFSVDYPLNKTKFVQATVTGLIYYEGDAEPLSNVSDRPIISAQLITNLADGISTASAESMRKSMEDSAGQKLHRPGGLMWLYILIFVIAGIGIAGLILQIRSETSITELVDLLTKYLQSVGVK